MNYTIWRGRLCPSKVRFFDAFFALFSILLGNYYGFGGIRISSLILIFGRHLSNRPLKIRGYQKSHFWFFWRAFLLQILLIFEDITELYMLRPLLGRSEGDVCGRLFAPARHSQFAETPRSHVKKIETSTFLKPVGENHGVKYHKH